MGNSKHSIPLPQDYLESLTKETGFSEKNLGRLYVRFSGLDVHGKGFLQRHDLLAIPQLTINPLGDRIVHAIFREAQEYRRQKNLARLEEEPGEGSPIALSDERIDFSDFARVLARFRPFKKGSIKNKLNSREEKLKFAFRMYDLDGDGSISAEELLAVLTMMVGGVMGEDQLVSIAERTIVEADQDKDQRISFLEFKAILTKSDIEQKMSVTFLK